MAIVRTEAYFNSSTGHNKIYTRIWQEDTLSPIGVFQIAHGMAEHITRYDDFACFLAKNGFVVCGNDHLGHGESVNDFSDLGYFAQQKAYVLTYIPEGYYEKEISGFAVFLIWSQHGLALRAGLHHTLRL